MNGDGGLRYRNWDFLDPSLKESLGLQLNSSVAERDTKPLFGNGGFLHRDSGLPEAAVPMDFVADWWIHLNKDSKILPALQVNHHPSYGSYADALVPHNLHMMQAPELPKDDHVPMTVMEDHPGGRNNTSLKKRPQGCSPKSPKMKKPKKATASRDGGDNGSVSKGKAGKKSTGMVINGIDLDTSQIPTPVCSCTGTPQQCYRWGVGGWQSACCTTTMSVHPLPMSTKRRGARIAGRKMSQGAFKKVLEKLAGEGFNIAHPIDLRTFWAKHGTNKFVAIR